MSNLIATVMAERIKTTLGGGVQHREYLKRLTTRERAIFWSVVDGCRSVDIAATLVISKHTVDTHRRSIIKKLGFTSSSEWFKLAEELNYSWRPEV